MTQILIALCLALLVPLTADAQRGGNPDALGADDRKLTYYDGSGTYSEADFHIASDAFRQADTIMLSQAQVDKLPFPATKQVTRPNGITQTQPDLTATVDLDGTSYEMKAFLGARGQGLRFLQHRDKTVELRPLNAAFHTAFRADPTIKLTITAESTGESLVLYEGTLASKPAEGGGRGR